MYVMPEQKKKTDTESATTARRTHRPTVPFRSCSLCEHGMGVTVMILLSLLLLYKYYTRTTTVAASDRLAQGC